MQSIEQLIAQEINAQPRQVAATVALLGLGLGKGLELAHGGLVVHGRAHHVRLCAHHAKREGSLSGSYFAIG
mgnify:CR=1 FL=1